MNRDYTLTELRENYKKSELLEDNADANPFVQFKKWFDEAMQAKLPEPNAMCLSTCGKDLQPKSRIVLLKELNAGFIFYTNYNSNKAQQLAENPNAALNFLWLGLERQVKITGKVEKLDAAQSEAYFKSRPLGSQFGAIASNQSQVIENRKVLEDRLTELKDIYSTENPPPMPKDWGGYILKPSTIEFWQGRPSRLHDRLRYTLEISGGWKVERLAP